MSRLPAIALVATTALLIYSFFAVYPGDRVVNTAAANEAADIELYVNGEKIEADVSPQMVNGTTFVPIRWVADALGATIGWDSVSKSMRITKDDISLRLTVGSKQAMNGTEKVTLNASPFILDGRTFVPVRWISEALNLQVDWLPETRTINIYENTSLNDDETLAIVGDFETLEQLLADASQQSMRRGGLEFLEEAVSVQQEFEQAGADQVTGSADAKSSEPTASSDYSETNVQVYGVDEADVVKTDGTYIFQINDGRILIAKAAPADEMKVVQTIPLQSDGFHPTEMYVDDQYLVVIGTKYVPHTYDKPIPMPRPMTSESTTEKLIMPAELMTVAYVYDRQNIESIQKIRELELDGYYLTSRKVGSSLYFVTNRYFPIYRIMDNENELPIPQFRDSAVSDQLELADLNKMVYRPGHIDANYLIVAGINLDKPEQKMDVTTFLGAGNTVYASKDHLYAVVTKYIFEPIQDLQARDDSAKQPGSVEQVEAGAAGQPESVQPMETSAADQPAIAEQVEARTEIVSPTIAPYEPPKEQTAIYQFALHEGTVTFARKGEVPGRILNQFSMDEHNGHFRIATTTGNMWANGDNVSKNHLFILNENLQTVGSVEDLAPGERIYSVRLMGDRGYIVTFRNVDPLFVLDLADPTQPELLGELKIPGYSDYLHPYDENHLLGFGMDTIVVEHKDERGRVVGETAYTQGMKISLFDITDVHHPIEKFVISIGDRGTTSPLLYNHKALMFAKNKDLLAFPVTVMEVPSAQKIDQNGYPLYGNFAFQGAYVYEVNPEDGFKLRATITHQTEDEIRKSGQYHYYGNNDVERILYIGDTLYTLSQQMIQAHDMNAFNKIGELNLR